MLEENDYYTVNLVLIFKPSFTDSSLSSEGYCRLARMNVKYTDRINKVMFDHRDEI